MGPNSTPERTLSRTRLNPLEFTIFAAVASLFFYSVYHLFYEEQGFQPTALSATAITNAQNGTTIGRGPASASVPLFSNVEVNCSDGESQTITQSNKVRFIGTLCGAPSPVQGEEDSDPWTSTQVAITTATTSTGTSAGKSTDSNQITVFNDFQGRRFSTEYVSLASGSNRVAVKFHFRSGKTIVRNFEVVKN